MCSVMKKKVMEARRIALLDGVMPVLIYVGIPKNAPTSASAVCSGQNFLMLFPKQLFMENTRRRFAWQGRFDLLPNTRKATKQLSNPVCWYDCMCKRSQRYGTYFDVMENVIEW